MTFPKISCSTVTPVYSGEKYLETLVRELDDVRKKWLSENAPISLNESIFVVDDAIDGSAEILHKLAQEHQWVVVLHLSKNFGQHPATQAGILHSGSDWIITLDEDLQHPPEQIEALFRKVVEGKLDIVYAQPEATVHESYLRDMGSRCLKLVMTLLTGNQNITMFNSFRLIRGTLARAASSVCSHDTYFDVALSWFSQRVGSVEMSMKDKRFISEGKGGYTFRKLLSHARRMIISTQAKVFHAGAYVGLFSILVSVVFGLYILLLGGVADARGWSSTMITILFFGGVSTFLIGLLTEYMSVILFHIQGKPSFFVIDRKTDTLLEEYFKEKTK